MARILLKIKGYPDEAKELVDIWEKYSNSGLAKDGFNYVTFVNKRPQNPKTQNRRIMGFNAESISYLNNDRELIKMSVENFIYLMAKCGVDIEVNDLEVVE